MNAHAEARTGARRPVAHLWRWVSILAGLALAGSLQGAPLKLDLGEGLVYFRVHELPTDLPPAATEAVPLVLDLRYTTTAESAAIALDAWLKFRATATTPVLVLINATTPVDLLRVLAGYRSAPGLLSIGPTSAEFTPDIGLAIKPDVDRRAYDALEHGTTAEALITENTDKRRSDEAALMHARSNPPAESSESDLGDFDGTEDEAKPPATPAPARVIDAALQRAVQLHRALLALKRI